MKTEKSKTENSETENSMRIAVVEIDEKELFIGAKVKNIRTNSESTIVRDDVRWFDMKPEYIHVSTVLLNKQLFELLKDEEDDENVWNLKSETT